MFNARPASLLWSLAALVATVVALTASSCSGCEQRVVQSVVVGRDEIAVVQRVCGSVSGYQLSIAPAGLDTTGKADRYEPFMVVCDCYDLTSRTPSPVRFSLEPDNVVRVRYDGSKMWRVNKQRPTQGKFRLIYEPSMDERVTQGAV